MEWVTPEGEIVRTGSLGSGDGWFCSEGPGPSRARHLPGHARQPRRPRRVHQVRRQARPAASARPSGTSSGTLPAYRLPVHETHARLHARRARLGRLGGDLLQDLRQRDRLHLPPPVQPGRRRPRARLLAHVQRPHQDALRRAGAGRATRRSQELTEELRISFQLILAGRSKDDIELQDKILDAILDEVGGWKVERFCEQDMAEFTNVYLQRLGHKHINFVWAGGYIGSWMQFGTPDWVKGYIPTAAAGLERDAAGGKLVQCGGDAMMGSGSGIPLRRRHRPRAVRQLRPRRLRVHGGRRSSTWRTPSRTPPPSATRPARSSSTCRSAGPTSRSGRRSRSAKQPQVVPLPAPDQGGVRPERRGRPHVPDAAGGLRGRQLTESLEGAGRLLPGPPRAAAPGSPVARCGFLDRASSFDNSTSSHLDT